MRPIQTGSIDRTLIATAYNTDGSVKTDLAFNTAGISIFVQRIGAADGTPMSLSAKATPATAHNDGAFLNLGGGDISVDVPDAPLSGYLGKIRIYGTFTGGIIVGNWYPVVGYNPDVAAVGALVSLGATAPADWLTALAIAAGALNGKGDWNVGKTGYSLTETTGLGNQTANLTGTISTVTNLTNLPSIPANWLTATGIAAGAFTSAKFAAGAFDAVWTVAARVLTAASDSSGVTTLLTRITALLRTKAEDDAAEFLVSATVASGTITEVTITSPVAQLASSGYVEKCIAVITDTSTGLRVLRFISTHSLGGGGEAILYFEDPLPFLPASGDTISIRTDARFVPVSGIATEVAKIPKSATALTPGQVRHSIAGGSAANITIGPHV